jgi:hypothetical protein
MRYISPVDAAIEAATEPTLPPMPLIRRVVTCSGCGTQGLTYTKCLTRVKYQLMSIFVIKFDVQNFDFLKFRESGRSKRDPRWALFKTVLVSVHWNVKHMVDDKYYNINWFPASVTVPHISWKNHSMNPKRRCADYCMWRAMTSFVTGNWFPYKKYLILPPPFELQWLWKWQTTCWVSNIIKTTFDNIFTFSCGLLSISMWQWRLPSSRLAIASFVIRLPQSNSIPERPSANYSPHADPWDESKTGYKFIWSLCRLYWEAITSGKHYTWQHTTGSTINSAYAKINRMYA